MSCHAGPDIVENGLVFCYDMNNTQKSWRGKPTTNLLTDPSNFNSISWIKARNTGSLPTVIKENILDRNGVLKEIDKLTLPSDGTYPRIHQYWTPANTTTHTFSIYLKNAGGTVSTCDIVIFRNSPWTGVSYNTVNLTSSWRLFTVSFNPLDTTTHMIYIGSHDSAKGAIFYLADAQLEINLFATPFVNGSRSNTQAILDLTNNNTITASNLSYNSDGSFNLDGTDDYFMTGPINGIGSSTTSFSMSVWVYPSSTAGNIISMSSTNPSGSWNMPPIAATGQQFFGKIWSNNRLYSSTYSLNTWYNLVLVFNYTTSGQYFYVNGNLTDSQTGITYGASGASNYLFFGQQNPGADNCGMFSGKIGDIKIYTNKALSAAEIAQNFNATRRIYGI